MHSLRHGRWWDAPVSCECHCTPHPGQHSTATTSATRRLSQSSSLYSGQQQNSMAGSQLTCCRPREAAPVRPAVFQRRPAVGGSSRRARISRLARPGAVALPRSALQRVHVARSGRPRASAACAPCRAATWAAGARRSVRTTRRPRMCSARRSPIEALVPRPHVRAGAEVFEDPGHGSCSCAFAGPLAVGHRDGKHGLRSSRGYEMNRPSLIHLSLTIQGGALTSATVGGDAVLVSEGTIEA